MKMLRFLLLVSVGLWIGEKSQATEPIVIRFSHVVAEDTPKGRGANRFRELVAQRLGQRVLVEVYPNARPFDDREALEELQGGTIEMAAPSLGKLTPYSTDLQIHELPFFFDNLDGVHRLQNSATGRKLLQSMSTHGLKGLAYWDNGMRVLSANRIIREPDDLHGLKCRIEPDAVLQRCQFERLGAIAVELPFSMLDHALMTGEVNCQHNTWSNINSKGVYKRQTHFLETNHSYLGYMVVTNSDFWDALPLDIRTELEEILLEVSAEVNRIAVQQSAIDRRKVADSELAEISSLSTVDRQAWVDASQSCERDLERVVGQDLIDAARKAANE